MSYYTDALLNPMDSVVNVMNGSSDSSSPLQYTYKFTVTMPSYLSFSGYQAMSDSLKSVYRDAMSEYEEIINVDINETTGSTPIIRTILADLPSGIAGYGGYTYSYSYNSSGVNMSYEGYTLFYKSLNTSANSKSIVLHEIGHAFSLKHPGNYDAAGGTESGPFLSSGEDNNKYTVMSYNSNPDNGLDSDALMLYDIAALQTRWGANYSTRTGNDTYAKPSTRVKCVWDAAGTDTFDGSAESGSVNIDLRPGAFSSIGGTNNLSIAYGAMIENANGGGGSDTLYGNGSANEIKGEGGNDFIDGRLGKDTLFGGDGGDTLFGGKGWDTLYGDSGNDLLGGGVGADTLYGGAGADTFNYSSAANSYNGNMDTIADFSRSEGDKIKLSSMWAFVSGNQANLQSAVNSASPGALSGALDVAAKTNGTDNGVCVFTYSSDTYLFLETSGAWDTYNGSDLVIKVSGTPGITFAGDVVTS